MNGDDCGGYGEDCSCGGEGGGGAENNDCGGDDRWVSRWWRWRWCSV